MLAQEKINQQKEPKKKGYVELVDKKKKLLFILWMLYLINGLNMCLGSDEENPKKVPTFSNQIWGQIIFF